MVVCTLIVANLSGWFLMNRAKTMLLEQCKQNAGSSAKIAAQRIDGDLLEQLQAGDEGSADYEEILSQLQEFLCGDEIKYIYTMRMNGDTQKLLSTTLSQIQARTVKWYALTHTISLS